MQKNIHRKSRLAIISDTGMCLKGGIYIFEPVFREVKNFSHLFGEIIWMGYENFYAFDGQVRNLPSTVRRYIFDDLNSLSQVFDSKSQIMLLGSNNDIDKMNTMLTIRIIMHTLLLLAIHT